jgi:hypothetical protein
LLPHRRFRPPPPPPPSPLCPAPALRCAGTAAWAASSPSHRRRAAPTVSATHGACALHDRNACPLAHLVSTMRSVRICCCQLGGMCVAPPHPRCQRRGITSPRWGTPRARGATSATSRSSAGSRGGHGPTHHARTAGGTLPPCTISPASAGRAQIPPLRAARWVVPPPSAPPLPPPR